MAGYLRGTVGYVMGGSRSQGECSWSWLLGDDAHSELGDATSR